MSVTDTTFQHFQTVSLSSSVVAYTTRNDFFERTLLAPRQMRLMSQYGNKPYLICYPCKVCITILVYNLSLVDNFPNIEISPY